MMILMILDKPWPVCIWNDDDGDDDVKNKT